MDQLIRSIDKDFSFRLFLIRTEGVVEEARQLHNLSDTATVALGKLLTANLLLSADLKNREDRLTLQFRGNGPGGFLISTANGDGNVKGYVQNPSVSLPKNDDGTQDVSSWVGKEGTFVIVRDYGMKEPYTAHSPLITGTIAEDIAGYYYQTERIPTALQLGVLLNDDGSVKLAGGYFLQAMPGVTDEELVSLESKLLSLPPITELLAHHTLDDILTTDLADFAMERLDSADVFYRCDCSKEKVQDAIMSLSKEELQEMKDEDKGAEVICHFCNKAYVFSEEELQVMIDRKQD